MSRADFGTALVAFRSDIQQTNPRQVQTDSVPRIGRAHFRISDQIVFIGSDVSPDVKKHIETTFVSRWPQARDCRSVDPGRAFQFHHGYRHQGTCVPAGDRDLGLLLAHRLYCGPHGCAFSVSEHGTRLHRHRDHSVAMADFAFPH